MEGIFYEIEPVAEAWDSGKAPQGRHPNPRAFEGAWVRRGQDKIYLLLYRRYGGEAFADKGESRIYAGAQKLEAIKRHLAGADVTACVKATLYNMVKEGFAVMVLSDCITSYDKRKIEKMLRYYQS